MGTGRYAHGKFDMTAVANFVMTADDWAAWERCFGKVSEILYNLSEGQLSFGDIFMSDDSAGLDTADLILYGEGDPSYSSGDFGTPGGAVHLMPYVQRQVLSLLHELGHHIFDLGDEYCQPYLYFDIDTSSPAPDRRTIPILDSGRPNNDLHNQAADVMLKFGDQYERKAVTADTATSISVGSDFSDLPTNSAGEHAVVQIPAECSAVADSNYCVMATSRGAAGTFDAAGNWTDAAHPVTELCTASNHDPDSDTAQESSHGKSCWESIIDLPDFAGLAVPDPASGVLPGGHVAPTVVRLEKQPRFALVLDRSGSMVSGHKMADAQYGAVYWLEHCAQGNDLLTVIWYDDVIDRILDLTEVSTLPDVDDVIDDINALFPRGTTNIRDGLFEALHQIESPGTRAAVQVALLLTDGQHNTPHGTHASEVLPDFSEGGVRIYTLGVGEPDEVDMNVLDDLAEDTGGTSYAVQDNEPGVVQAAMIEIDDEVRGGIITTSPQSFPDSHEWKLDEIVIDLLKKYPDKRPPLKDTWDILGIHDEGELLHPPHPLDGLVAAIPVDVEDKCERVTFTLVYPLKCKLWLYLRDPAGNLVDMSSWPVRHVISQAPHEFAIVEHPRAGRWYMIAVRAAPGPAFRFRAIAGGQNRNIQVFGGAKPKNAPGAPVRIYASGRFQHDLSQLRVTATVTSPSGITRLVTLSDDKPEEPNSGEYEGYFRPDELGRYHGRIRIQNTGRAIIAKPARRLLDAEAKQVQLAAGAPRFVRVIPFYFDSGVRPKIKDTPEKESQ